jgi:tryptophan synthase alpha chain
VPRMAHNHAVLTLADRFSGLRARGEKALVLFFTAGDQPLEQLPELLAALEEGGADVIEVGIPFSDPFGEGPTIQASSQRALDNGATPRTILEAVGRAKKQVPVVTMGYYNPILRFGIQAFAESSRAAGIGGTIVSDLIPDESDDWCRACREFGIDTIFLAAPTSTSARIEEVARRSTGFVYAVSRTGVTGAENQVPDEVSALVARIRALTDKPVCVGFGISKPEHVAMVCQVADGAVVGSALVDVLHRKWDDGRGRAEIVRFVRALKSATSKA